MIKKINARDLREMLQNKEDVVILDARDQFSYRLGHIKGAFSLPIDEVHKLAKKLVPDKNEKIVVYCRNIQCVLSPAEAQELKKMGYKNILHFAGGIQEWMDKGLPIQVTARA